MYIYRYLLVLIFVHLADANRNVRHIHSHKQVKKLEQSKAHNNNGFFLRCPKIPHSGEKLSVNVAWIQNDQTLLSIINGKVVQLFNGNMTVKRWHTLDNQLNILANTSRWKFEYEEKRRWYALKIQKPSVKDDGLWKCRMIVWFGKSGVARRYESRKRIYLKNRSEFFTFKKRNLSDAQQNWDTPVTFTKPNADFTVFSRMSKFNDVAYIRNSDIMDKSESAPTQVGFLLQTEDDAANALLMRNYSSVHALPSANSSVPQNASSFLLALFAVLHSLIFSLIHV